MIISRKTVVMTDGGGAMTVKEAINRSAVLYPCELDGEKAYIYLDELEAMIEEQLLGTEHTDINPSTDEAILSVSGTYSQIYPLYIAMRRELACGDADRYEFLKSVFEQLYTDLANRVNRERKLGQPSYIKNI